MDFSLLPVARRTRFGTAKFRKEKSEDIMKKQKKKKREKKDNASVRSHFEVIDIVDMKKRRRFGDSSSEKDSEGDLDMTRGSKANPFCIGDDSHDDDDGDGDDEGSSSSSESGDYDDSSFESNERSDLGVNGVDDDDDGSSSCSSHSSSSHGFREIDSPYEELITRSYNTKNRNKKNRNKKNEKKPSSSSPYFSSSSSSDCRIVDGPELDEGISDSDSEKIIKKKKKKKREHRETRNSSSSYLNEKKKNVWTEEVNSSDDSGMVKKKKKNKEQRKIRKSFSSLNDKKMTKKKNANGVGYTVARNTRSNTSRKNEVPGEKRDVKSSESTDDEKPAKKPRANSKLGSDSKEAMPVKGMKRDRGQRDANLYKVLVNSMTDEAVIDGVDNLAARGRKMEDKDEAVFELTLKFRFPEVKKRSECEKYLDPLWSELNVSLASEEIGSSATNVMEDGDCDLDELCARGKHKECLNDELGICCTNCKEILVDIKDLLPSFGKNHCGRSRYRDLGNGKKSSFLSEFGLQELGNGYLSDGELRARAETVWDVIPGVKATMYSHQREGFEFIWTHIAGGIHRESFERVKRFESGRGCIISHAPGTGKSRLAIVFLQALMKLHPSSRPVIIAPSSMLLTWEEEFKKWKVDVPFHNLNSAAMSGKEDEAVIGFLKREGGCKNKRAVRIGKLRSWKKGGSVLGISYTTFEKMAGASGDEADEIVRKTLLDSPGLLVLDEGHIPRNNDSLIWQVLSRVKTPKRVLLSGTPFQNNFKELYNTMSMVNPRFSEPAKHGSCQTDAWKDWKSLTKSMGEDAGSEIEAARLKQIKSIIDPFVHIHRGDVLENSLPGLKESIIVLRPSALQKTLLGMIQVKREQQLQLECAVSLISIHPSLASELKNMTFPISNSELNALRSDPDAGVKMRFLIGLIRICEAIGERVLVFSQYLGPLSLVMEHLKERFGWSENAQVLTIDGKRDMKERQLAINRFNDPKSAARVLLVSTKAGGEGINLVGASRVVLLDVVWNPSVERQATRRAYRLGQKKFVYIYHLVASGTMEENKYSRQAAKSRLSNLVFSTSGENCEPNGPQSVKKDSVLESMVQNENLKDIFKSIGDKLDSELVDSL